MRRKTIATIAIALLLLPLSAFGLDFDYIKIADTNTAVPDGLINQGLFGAFQQPALNGYSVAFRGNKAAVGGGSQGKDALYISSGGALTQIVSSSTAIPAGSGTFNGYGDPAPNSGNIAFSGTNNVLPIGIYSNVNGLNRVADTGTPIPSGTGNFTSFGTATSLDGGNILFYGVGASGQQGLYSSAGGLHAVANTSTPIPGGTGSFTSFSNGANSNGGSIAFNGAGSSGQSGIYTDASGTLQLVADKNTLAPGTGANFTSFGLSPSISSGNVAFQGNTPSQSGIYTDIGGLNAVADLGTTIPSGTGNFLSFGTTPSLSSGSVVYYGMGTGLSGIFTNYGGTQSAVITNAMFLDGKKISGFFGSVGISSKANSNGNVAFYASFTDNSTGIYVAELTYDYAANASGAWDTASSWGFGLKPRTVVYTNIHPTNGAVITGPSLATTIRGLDLGATTTGQAELRLQTSGQLAVNEYMYVEGLGKLNVNGGVASAALGIYNYGDIDLGNGGQTNGGTLQNSGTLHGSGTVGNLVYNYNKIQAIGTQMTFTQGVYNLVSTASIQARSALLQFNGGLSNAGSVDFSFGASDVFGPIDNLAADPMGPTPGGQIILSGNCNVTFYDPVVHNGDVFRVSTGSTAVFFGQVSGAGAFTGDGAKFFEGGYSPGNSPAAVSLDGPVTFGDNNTLKIELGGTTVGAQYDHIAVAGQLTLGGTLQVSKIDLNNDFSFAAGQSYDVLDWGSVAGTFSALQLPALAGGLQWNTTHLYTAGVLSIALSGDFNFNGVVDAADYVVWRKGLGTIYTQADYNLWRTHFGQKTNIGAGTNATSPSAAVPESATVTLFLMAFVVAGAMTRRTAQFR